VTIAPPQLLAGESRDITLALQDHLTELQGQAHAARQKRPSAREPIFTVALLGIDGSGKSTLSRLLAEQFSAEGKTCLISDRLQLYSHGQSQDMQPLLTESLRRWVSRRAKQARSLAHYKIPKLAELLLRDRLLQESCRWYRPDSVFMDGMPLLNLTAWAILYREEYFTEQVCAKTLSILGRCDGRVERDDPIFAQFPELVRLQQLRLDRMCLPDAVIFLDVPPMVCLERIDSRGESKQVHETEEKLAKLREAYLLVCSVLAHDGKNRVIALDGNRELARVMAEARDFVGMVKEDWHAA
jgi:adenylate kinase family enzyme